MSPLSDFFLSLPLSVSFPCSLSFFQFPFPTSHYHHPLFHSVNWAMNSPKYPSINFAESVLIQKAKIVKCFLRFNRPFINRLLHRIKPSIENINNQWQQLTWFEISLIYLHRCMDLSSCFSISNECHPVIMDDEFVVKNLHTENEIVRKDPW